MILPWLIYGTGVGLLFAAAAWLVEITLRERGWPVRWVWVGALLALVLVPAVAVTMRKPRPESPVYTFIPAGEAAAAGAFRSEAAPQPSATASAGATRPPRLTRAAVDRWIVRGWAAASTAVVVSFAIALASLWRSWRGWRREVVDGRTVWVSSDTGPAVVGAFPGSVVVPEWLLRLPHEQRELILRHEEEHVSAGDAPVLLIVLLLRAVLPWNPALWWIGRSLRRAVEIDCDRRVLARGADARAYARVLLDVSERGTPHRLAVAALSESQSFLERRIRLMIANPTPLRGPRMAAAMALALAAAVTACRMDQPEAEPIVATGFSMPPAEAEPSTADAAEDTIAVAAAAVVRPSVPVPSQQAIGDSIEATFRSILEARHPEVLSGALRGERVNLYVAIDGNGDVAHSAVDTEPRSGSCTRIVSEGLGMELDRDTFGGGGCGRLEAGVAGPSPISYFWRSAKPATDQQRIAPTGPYQIARLLQSTRPSREMLAAAVRQHFPDVYEQGLPQGEGLWFVGDAYHQVVHAGRGWERATSAAAQAEIEEKVPGIRLDGGLMTGIRSAADTPIGIYWARLASLDSPPSEARPDPYPAAHTYAVSTDEAGREVEIRLEGEAAEDPRAFRISGRFTNEGGVLTAVTPFTLIIMTPQPFRATLRMQGEGEMLVETESESHRLRTEARAVVIDRERDGAPTQIRSGGDMATVQRPGAPVVTSIDPLPR